MKINKSARITKLFIKIPITIEKKISPFLYSFFQGLKKVLINNGKESKVRMDLLKEEKKLKSSFGASKYQNFRNIKGRFK